MANRVPLILNTSSNQIQELPTGDNLDLSNSGIHNAGVITATSFTGDGSALTGLTAAGTGAIGGLTVKDEGSVVGTAGSISSFDFRGSYITATANTGAAGVTTVTLSETPTFSAVTVTNNINANGNIVGDNSTNITGIAGVTATNLTGTLQTAAQPNITSLGSLSSLNVIGNVSVGGTLTYEDVTNVDSVGIATARVGLKVLSGGINAVGVVTATSFTGSIAASNIDSGTVATARLGSGTANSSSFLRGDQTWAAVTSTTINNNADNRLITGSGTANTLEAEANLTFDNSTNKLAITGADSYVNIGTNNKRTQIRNNSTSTYLYSYADSTFHVALAGSGNRIQFDWVSGVMCDMVKNGAVNLYHNNNSKLSTTSTGISVTGTVAATAFTGDGSALTGIAGGVTSDSDGNTVGGSGAGDNFTSGQALSNALFGKDAGNDITTGDHNVAFGAHTLDACDTGRFNTAVGNDALGGLTGGVESTAFGYSAGLSGNGNKNVFMGYCAGQSITSGENTVVGYEAGKANATNDGLVAFGYAAAHNATGTGRLTAIGYQAAAAHQGGNGNTYVGYEAGKLNVNGNMNCVMGDQTVRNSSDFARATVFGAYSAGGFGSNANDNTVIGYNAANTTLTGTNNTIIGSNANASGNVSNEITLGDGNITKFRVPGVKFEAQNDTYYFSCDHNLASYVQRFDGVWGNWAPNFNFKATGASPSGTTLGQWGNHQNGHALTFVKSRDNGNAGTSCQAGDDLGSIFWSPYNSANSGCAAAVKVMASGAYNSTSNPAYMQIMTTPDGSKEPTERVRIGSHGGVIFKGGPLQEKVKITAGKLSASPNIDLADGNVHYFTTQESTTSTPNLRVNSTTMLNSVMEVGETVAVTIITTAGSGGYSAALQIHGNNQTVNWVGASAPAAGGSSGVDIYNYTIIKTGNSAFTVIGNLTKTS